MPAAAATIRLPSSSPPPVEGGVGSRKRNGADGLPPPARATRARARTSTSVSARGPTAANSLDQPRRRQTPPPNGRPVPHWSRTVSHGLASFGPPMAPAIHAAAACGRPAGIDGDQSRDQDPPRRRYGDRATPPPSAAEQTRKQTRTLTRVQAAERRGRGIVGAGGGARQAPFVRHRSATRGRRVDGVDVGALRKTTARSWRRRRAGRRTGTCCARRPPRRWQASQGSSRRRRRRISAVRSMRCLRAAWRATACGGELFGTSPSTRDHHHDDVWRSAEAAASTKLRSDIRKR